METLFNLCTKFGKPFNFLLKQAKVGAEQTSLKKSFQTVISHAISTTTTRQKRTKIAEMTTLKELINQSGFFEDMQ